MDLVKLYHTKLESEKRLEAYSLGYRHAIAGLLPNNPYAFSDLSMSYDAGYIAGM